MKKYGLIFIVVLLLIASIIFNYNLSSKLKASISFVNTLEVVIRESDTNNAILELDNSSLVETMSHINNQLQNKTDVLKLIDDKLEAGGEILIRIDELINENKKLRKELNTTLVALDILEEKNSRQTNGVILTETRLEQLDRDIQDILDFLDARISVLEDGIKSLSTFSIERIMVRQEIDFLEANHLKIIKLKEAIIVE